MMTLAVVCSNNLSEIVSEAAAGSGMRIVRLQSLHHAQEWLTAYPADVLVIEEGVLGDQPMVTLGQLRDSPYAAGLPCCVLTERHQPGQESCLPAFLACEFRIPQDTDKLRRFFENAGVGNGGWFPGRGLAGRVPSSGIRIVLPLLEAEGRSGRLTLRPEGAPHERVLWLKDGHPVEACPPPDDPNDIAAEVADIDQGWFCFVDSEVTDHILESVRSSYRHMATEERSPRTASCTGEDGTLREVFKATIASASNMDEIEQILTSFLDIGIDRAAGSEDVALLDELAELSILLEKKEYGKAFKVLRRL